MEFGNALLATKNKKTFG